MKIFEGKVVEHSYRGLILTKKGRTDTDLENFFYKYKNKNIRITIEEVKER